MAAFFHDSTAVQEGDAIAANMGLSTTHFLRLINAIRDTVAGHDLTRSAIDAGFATPSHFSETFRDMIGLSATTMLRAGIRFDLGAEVRG